MILDIRAPGLVKVIDIIRRAEGHPMFVGGCVLGAILNPGVIPKDIDIEVYGIDDLDDLAYPLFRAGFFVQEAGMSFNVLKVRHRDSGLELDISLPRTEGKTGAKHQDFDICVDSRLSYSVASARRDFTVNSIMVDGFTGEVIDCHGGLRDLEAGILRHTSAAFSEDSLRVLRAVQIVSRYGFTLAPETAELCRTLPYENLSVERIWEEWVKLGTRGIYISKALDVLVQTGWERHYPIIAAMHGVIQDPEWHPEGDVHIHSGMAADQAAWLADLNNLTGMDRLIIIFSALLHDVGKVTHTWLSISIGHRKLKFRIHGTFTSRLAMAIRSLGIGRIISYGHPEAGIIPAQEFLDSIGCPASITKRILPLIREHMSCIGKPTKPAVRRLVRRLVPASLLELVLVCGADSFGRGKETPNRAIAWMEIGRELKVEEKPAKGILTGYHLIDAGLKPGPLFKIILAKALEAQDAGEFDDEAGALAWFLRQEPITHKEFR